MHILQATSEFFPYSKTGGLADMVAGLSNALAELGHNLSVVTPLYRGVAERFPDIKPLGRSFKLPMGRKLEKARFWYRSESRRLIVYFVEHESYYNRLGIYMENGKEYADNLERFIFFSKAVVHLAGKLGDRPAILHCHDWQTGLALVMLRHKRLQRGNPRTCFTVHNIAYQGISDANQYPLVNLPRDYFTQEGVEFYGSLNPLKAGLVFADRLSTVSPSYAKEIVTPEFGEGLEGVAQARADHLKGILNGVDYKLWKTEGNHHLPYDYSLKDLRGKGRNKRDFLSKLGLSTGGHKTISLYASIGRLTKQKGTRLLLESMRKWLPGKSAQFVILGSGDPSIEHECRRLQDTFPKQVRAYIRHDESFAHRLKAAADFFVMPSLYEPCGLNQMYSLRFGTVPIVFTTGGLRDSVIDLKEFPRHGNGFKLPTKKTRSLLRAYDLATQLKSDPRKLNRIRRRGIRAQFDWNESAIEYVKLYNS